MGPLFKLRDSERTWREELMAVDGRHVREADQRWFVPCNDPETFETKIRVSISFSHSIYFVWQKQPRLDYTFIIQCKKFRHINGDIVPEAVQLILTHSCWNGRLFLFFAPNNKYLSEVNGNLNFYKELTLKNWGRKYCIMSFVVVERWTKFEEKGKQWHFSKWN